MKDRLPKEIKIPEPSRGTTDWVAPVCMLLLLFIGVAYIYSAQSYNIDEVPFMGRFWVKQIIFGCIGFCAYAVIAKIDYEIFFRYAHLIYFFCLLLLIPLVLKEHFGIPVPFVQSRFNATRWIDLGPFSIQPSETAKIGTCIMVAAMLARSKVGTVKSSLKVLAKIAAVFFIPILLIFLQPDLGSTLVFPSMAFAMLYVSRLSKRFFAATLGAFVLCVSIVAVDIYGYANYLSDRQLDAAEAASLNAYGSEISYIPFKDYQRNRILSFVAPDVIDPKGRGVSWNQRQSLISVATGGLWGKGHAEGTQAKLGYLPSAVAYNDFIFSVIAEEGGFVTGALVIVLLSTLVVYSCMRAARLSRDRFGQYLCVGIAAILMTHVFINVGMTIGIMPITGVPLPMLSYGGSFILTCCILLGLVQSVYRHRQNYA